MLQRKLKETFIQTTLISSTTAKQHLEGLRRSGPLEPLPIELSVISSFSPEPLTFASTMGLLPLREDISRMLDAA